MVKYNDAELDRTFAALADPTRRAMLARLSLKVLSVSELAEPFDMTLPAVMKHLTVLADAGLVVREKTGRTVSCELQAKPMEDAVKWLNLYRAVLERYARPPNRLCGGRCMSAQLDTKPSLVIRRHIKAAPAAVLAAWTDPEKIMRWFGPNGADVTHAETQVRIGGRFHVCFHTPDGEEHNVSGEYRDVVPDRKLVFTWEWRTLPERVSLVTVSVTPDGAGTLLTLKHEQFFDEPARDRHQSGWAGALDKLEALFA